MKWIAALLVILCSSEAIPEQLQTEWWWPGVLGAPCTLQTDIDEGTCILEVKWKPSWVK